jgi:1-acyl-sn-glycerol-3-phosphate acyltransferase
MSKQDPDALPDSIAPELPLSQAWAANSSDPYSDEENWGADASLPPGSYGPSIRSDIPDPSMQRRALREIERRFRAIQSPAFPLEIKRQLPGAVLLDGYRSLAMRSRSLEVDPYGRDPRYCQSMHSRLNFLYRKWLKVDMQGLSNLPTDRAAILVCNHTSAFAYDALMLMHGVQTEHPDAPLLRPLLEDRIGQLPFLGVHLRKLGAVRACQENAERLLAEGAQIAVFPEGGHAVRRHKDSPADLQRFGRGGFIRLALRTGAPIVPVAIVSHATAGLGRLGAALPGPLQALPKIASRMAILPAPGRWTIAIGEPIDLKAEVGEKSGHCRATVARETAAVRAQILVTIESLLESQS